MMAPFILWFLKNTITLIVNFDQFLQTQLKKACEDWKTCCFWTRIAALKIKTFHHGPPWFG